MVLPLLDFISNILFILCKQDIDRTPSHFTSKTHCLSLKGSSTAVASIGFIFVGNSLLTHFSLRSTALVEDLFFIILLLLSVFLICSSTYDRLRPCYS